MYRGPCPFSRPTRWVTLPEAVAAVRNDLVFATLWGAVACAGAALLLALFLYTAYAIGWTFTRSVEQDFNWELGELTATALATFGSLMLAGLLIPTGAKVPDRTELERALPHGPAVQVVIDTMIYLTLSPVGGMMALVTRRRDLPNILGFFFLPAALARGWLRGIADTVWLARLDPRDHTCALAIYAETFKRAVPAQELDALAEAYGARRFHRGLKLLGIARWVTVVPDTNQNLYRLRAVSAG